MKELKIVDSSTISLFSDIIKGVGRNPISGKKKVARLPVLQEFRFRIDSLMGNLGLTEKTGSASNLL